MSADVRPAVVAHLVGIIGDDALTCDERVERVMAADATDAERSMAAGVLAGAAVDVLEDVGAIRKPPSLLDMSYRGIQGIVTRGVMLAYVLDQLGPLWASRPDAPLADVLKVVPRGTIARLAAELHRVGVHDLDVWLL